MLVARSGLSPVMVGRRGELQRLRRLLKAVGEPKVALVSGEAGVGKTRLIQELLIHVDAGVPILSAQAEQGAMGRPFELLLEAVEPSVRSWTSIPEELGARRDPLCLLLGPVVPGLVPCPERSYAPEELVRAAIDLVRHLAGSRSAVVVFEDLHWADAESLTLFGRLATIPDLPVLLVGSFRPEDLDRRHLTDLLAMVERQRSVEHFLVPRLGPDEVQQLMAEVYARPISAPIAEDLHRRTGGNPFFIEELLVVAGDAPPDQLASLVLPASLTEAVLSHLDGLTAAQRRVVDAAAVLGQRISFDLLATVCGAGEEELIEVLRELVDRGLVTEEDPDTLSFRHALTREAVAGRLLGRERRRLHEKALVALQEIGSDDWAALAYHASGANRWDELVEAARRGAAQYLRTGSTYQALRLAECGLAEADDDIELLELAARAAWSVGLRQSAIERAESWRRLAETIGDDANRFEALRLLARLRWEAGDRAGQRRMAEEALAVAELLGPSGQLASAYNLMAEMHMLAHESEQAIDWADRALTLAAQLDAVAVRAAVLVNKGSAMMDHGLAGQAESLLLEGASAAEATGDYLSALRALYNLSKTAFTTWSVERSRGLLERMTALVDTSGWREWSGRVAFLRSWLLLRVEGDLLTAGQVLDEHPSDGFDSLWG
ncbi:MAG TPA: AAA family ATPase, partial [Candidatus Limnocylindria bacterium]|nr:AAA family ATPase [Candidatus Limnocylindria bacterium]